MEHTSIWSKILTVIGFIFVASLLMSILGGIIGFALHVLNSYGISRLVSPLHL